jgi:hypothetical protein
MQAARNGIGLVALAVGIIACSDATQPTGPVPYEGAKVSMTGTSTISIPTLDGRVVSATTREWAVDGVVKNGLAEAKRSPVITDPNGPKMPLLFISDASPIAQGRANHRSFVSGRDARGNAEDFVFINGGAGPATTIVHVGANRQVDQAYSYEWKRVNGGWRAMAFTVTVFKNGKALARIRSANKAWTPPTGTVAFDEQQACIFDAKVVCDAAPILSGDGGAGSTATAPDGTPCNCSTQLTDYLLAASTAATATQLAIDTGTALIPMVAAGLAVMWAAAGVMLYRYQSCIDACKNGTASSGMIFRRENPLLSPYSSMHFRPA